ncbi:MAG: outer membrane lipoprotein carrier protein LolA [Deltaproteobacteria bacterium]|nr:outer membrane lipoprotein carrier protein LolA [Deltaproteobacteria bacterium]
MKIKIFLFLLPLLLALTPLAAFGADSPAEVMAKVQAQYDKTGAFQARFQQESRLKAMQQTDSAAGWMYFQKPSRMRWQYEIPAAQKKEVVTDGRLVWMYMPQDSVVMVYKLEKVLRSDLVMRFFSGIGQFQRDFTVSWNRPPKEGESLVLDLFPKKEQAELKRLTLTINPKTYLVDKLEFSNALGEETRFTFSQIKLDVKLTPEFFSFKPPPGVQVVRQ